MKKKLVTLIPYAVVLLISFYLLPLLVKNTGMAMLMMLCILPLISLVCSIIYGVRYGFDLLLPIIVVFLFTPTILIFYNSSAWIYIVIYGVVSLAGNLIGKMFYKKR